MHRIYLVPGFFGFANLGELKYFGHVRDFLARECASRGLRAEIHVVKTPPTSSLTARAARLAETIDRTASPRDPVHLVGHSSGGLDARLMIAPGVALPVSARAARRAARVRTVVAVATPHLGTPLASFFAGMLGQRLLQNLSLSTIYLLRFGHLPISALLQLATIFTRLDNLAANSALLDELFGHLLADFSVGRRRAVQRLLGQIARDQALLLQLTPEAMDLFDAVIAAPPGVRCGSVVTRARRPGIRATFAAGIDPSAHATRAIYNTLYRITAHMPRGLRPLRASQARALRRAYGRTLSPQANDGVVPTRSQVWGEVIAAVDADHLDVIGHFRGPDQTPPHYDWLTTGSGFDRAQFEAVWSKVVAFIERGASPPARHHDLARRRR